jgi:transcriptional regulator of heat shock response
MELGLRQRPPAGERNNLGLRQQKILAAIVKEYSETAEPVGSKELVEKYNLKVSSATIRNEMAWLEERGYISQPHKSAGRVPTDKGYRLFVNELMRRFELSEKERRMLREQLSKLQLQQEQLGRSIAQLISQVSGQASFALLPNDTSTSGLAHIVNEPELSDKKTLTGVAELFDHLDQHANKLIQISAENIETYIGKESPLPVPKNLSLVVSKVQMKDGKKGLIGILGPKRMSYAKNLSLLEYLSKLLSGTASIVILINY